MKKMFFLAATAALALSSCSSDELVQAEQPVVEDGAVNFSVYTGRANRAAKTSDKDQNVDDALLQKKGFGVFAYEQGPTKLVSYLASNTYPNFFYNQKVMGYTTTSNDKPQGDPIWDGTPNGAVGTFQHWDYTPLKYWPNNDAYVTYQAYAPYNPNVEAAFNVAYNGVGVRYKNTDNYDLLWGANAKTDGTDTKATCVLDKQKPSVGKNMEFYFRHALAKLDFTVSYFTDKKHTAAVNGPADGKDALDANTTIVVRSIKLVGDLPSQGVLSLYDGSWTIERTDANIGFNTADLVNYGKATTTQDATTWAWDKIVKEEEYGTLSADVQAVKPAESLMVIPVPTTTPEAAPVQVQVTYDVITVDPKDPRNSSKVTNTVTSGTSLPAHYADGHSFAGVPLKAGKWTTINIHLGLTSVGFDAEVVDWNTNGNTVNTEVDLPNNEETTT